MLYSLFAIALHDVFLCVVACYHNSGAAYQAGAGFWFAIFALPDVIFLG